MVEEHRQRVYKPAASPTSPPPVTDPEDQDVPQYVSPEENAIFERMAQHARTGGQGAPDPAGGETNVPPPPTTPPPTDGGELPPHIEQNIPYAEQVVPGTHTLDEYEKFCRLGYMTDTLEFGNNRVTMRTLTQKEELKIAEAINRFPPTARMLASQIYTVAMSLTHINDKPFYERTMLGPKDDPMEQRFKKVTDDFYAIHVERFFNHYLNLREEATKKALFAGKE